MRDWRSWLWYEGCYGLALAGMTFGFSIRFIGRRNVPRRGPALLVANHQSFLDPVIVGLASPRHLRYLARKTLFGNRLFAALITSLHAVPVDQDGVAKEGLKAVLKLLEAGEAVVVYPEGNRTETGQMQPLKPGILLLLARVAAPVVPVGIAGAFEALPRSRAWPKLSPLFLPTTGADIAVAVGAPIPAQRYRDLPRKDALEDLAAELERVRQQAERLRRKG
jgi:1-acyl-sn-glycerol-3-phosphate acyltransferase